MASIKYFYFIFLLQIFVVKTLSFELYSELNNVNIENYDSSCVEDIKLILNTAFNSTINDREWATRMIDSSAKIPNGLLGGSLVHIGQFDECIQVSHPNGQFIGQHCMAEIVIKTTTKMHEKLKFLQNPFLNQDLIRDFSTYMGLPLRYGICLPSTCSVAELNQIFNLTDITDVISISFSENNCWTSEPIPLSDGSWAMISIFIILFAIVLSSTLFELYQLHVLKNEKSNILNAFSLYSNTISLFEIRESSGEMACLHGIRTLSMMWVLLCHTFANALSMPIMNLIDAYGNILVSLKQHKKLPITLKRKMFNACVLPVLWISMDWRRESPSKMQKSQELCNNLWKGITLDINYILIVNGFYSVDSFFFLSGLLVAFVFFRNIGKNGYYDAPVNYIHRYLRLTPSLLFVILVNMTILMDLNKGPMWGSAVKPLGALCEESWWATILYIQNYAKPSAECLGQSWYLSADMQMFWIAPLVLYPIFLWSTIGMVFLAFLTVGSTLLTFGLAYANEYKAAMLIATDPNQITDDYITTHSRIMPWFVGVALGVAICAIKKRKIQIQLSKTTVILGWMFSTGVCLGILYGFNRFQVAENPSVAESAIYLSFTRLGWGVGLAWVVFACIYGYGGWVNTFLSLGIFQPLGKLSYNVYLVHMSILSYAAGVYRTNYFFSDYSILFDFFGTLILSYLFATALYLIMDAPFAILDRKLLSNIKILPYPRPMKKEPIITSEDIEQGETNESTVKMEKNTQ